MRAVDGGEIDAMGQGEFVGTGADGEHAAAGQVLHQSCAGGEKLQRVFQLEGAGEHGGDVFADAVADEQRRLDAP